jgi:hypothetical protein
MMTKRMAIGSAAVVMMVAACSSDDSGAPACAPEGNYSATATRLSGTCDAALDPKGATSFSMTKGSDGTYTAVVPGIAGGCPGTLDTSTCVFRSACEVRGTDGALVLTSNLEYTFTAKGYTGSSVNGISPPTVATRCEVTYRESGTKL